MDEKLSSESEELYEEESGPAYVDPHFRAVAYLAKHGILPLFREFLNDMVLHRPADPIQYMIDRVEGTSYQTESIS
ncbi:unnamed protein product [Dicrocoelium dendriticum]|nr:unnamed protein product [Dicrocoelium dendriticum]